MSETLIVGVFRCPTGTFPAPGDEPMHTRVIEFGSAWQFILDRVDERWNGVENFTVRCSQRLAIYLPTDLSIMLGFAPSGNGIKQDGYSFLYVFFSFTGDTMYPDQLVQQLLLDVERLYGTEAAQNLREEFFEAQVTPA